MARGCAAAHEARGSDMSSSGSAHVMRRCRGGRRRHIQVRRSRSAAWARTRLSRGPLGFHSVLHCSGALARRREALLSDFRAAEQRVAARFGDEELRRLRLSLADAQHMVMIPACAGETGIAKFASAVAALDAIARP